MIDAPCHLLDVNVLIALLVENHVHHLAAKSWLKLPGLQWAICPFSEAGCLRYMTQPVTRGISMLEATAMLLELMQLPGYRYQPIHTDWQTLTAPFSNRIFGHKQITDAFLLGLAVREGLVLVTFDRAILHLAGEHRQNVLLLET